MVIHEFGACEKQAADDVSVYRCEFGGELLRRGSCSNEVVEEYHVLASEEVGVGAHVVAIRLADDERGVVVLRFAHAEDIHVCRAVLYAGALAYLLGETLKAAVILGTCSRRNTHEHIVLIACAVPFTKALAYDVYGEVYRMAVAALERINKASDAFGLHVVGCVALRQIAVETGCLHFLSSLYLFSEARRELFTHLICSPFESFFYSRRVEFRFLRRKKTVEARREDKQKGLKFYGKPSF